MTFARILSARPSTPVAAVTTAVLLTACLALPARAQIIPTGSPAADILLSQAIAEHRVFLTCSALDPATHALIRRNWQDDVENAVTILLDHGTPPEAIAAFRAAAVPEALLPAPDTAFAEVRSYCEANPDWWETRSLLTYIVLPFRLPEALAE